MIHRGPGRPAYLRIADLLRDEILTGRLPPGAKVPSEAELMARFDVGRKTVRTALAELRSEGRIVSRQGVGVFVREQTKIIRLPVDLTGEAGRPRGWLAACERAGLKPDVRTYVSVGPADPEIADHLGIPADTPVLIRERIMGVDGQPPMQLAVSHIPLEVVQAAPKLKDPDTGPGGMLARLEEAGLGPLWFETPRGARMPTPAETEAMHLDPGVPVMTALRLTYGRAGRCLDAMRRVVDSSRVEEVEFVGTRPRDG